MTRIQKVSCCLLNSSAVLLILSLPIPSSGQTKSFVQPTKPQTFPCLGANADVTSVHALQIPQKALEACNKGTQLFAEKDPAGSIVMFQKAIKVFPGYYEAYTKLGAAELDLENWGPAETAFRKSIELSGGKYAPADFGLGLILATVKNQYGEAETVIRNGLDLDPGDVTGDFVLAWVLYSTTRLREAEKSATEAVLSAPQFAGARLLLGQIHLAQKNVTAAISDLDAYLGLGIDSPMNAKVRQVRAEAVQTLAAMSHSQAAGKTLAGSAAPADFR
jgi:tetratricopeptide (TPR) repeat protein